MGASTLCAVCCAAGGRPGLPLCSVHEEEWSLSPESKRAMAAGAAGDERAAFDDFVRRRVAEIRNDKLAAAGVRQ